MAKPILNEQFKRMHKIAGLLIENKESVTSGLKLNLADESMKPTSKMTKKSLKAQIKEMILAEMDVDTSNDDNFYDFLAEMDEYDTELGEAKKKSKKDEEAPEEMDTEMNANVDLDIPPADATPEPTHSDVQKELTDALEAAKANGDEKLIRIIGNALTYFTRSQVAGEEGGNQGLNESFIKKMQRTAGIIK